MTRLFTYRELSITVNKLTFAQLDQRVILEIREETGELLHFYVDGLQEIGENHNGPVLKVEGDVVD